MGLINYCNPGDLPEEAVPEVLTRPGRVALSELPYNPIGASAEAFETFRDQLIESHEGQIRLAYLQGKADAMDQLSVKIISACFLLATLGLANLGSLVANFVASGWASRDSAVDVPSSETSKAVGNAQNELYHALNTSQNLIHPVTYCGPDLSIWGRIGKPVRYVREGTNAPKMCVLPSQFQMLDDACDRAKATD